MNKIERAIQRMKKESSEIQMFFENLIDNTQSNINVFLYQFKRLKRAFSWFKFMYTNEPWDHYYLYTVMQKKITEMRNCMRDYGHHRGSNHTVKIMNIALWYLERLVEDDICKSLYEKHERKFGKKTFAFVPCNDGSKCSYLESFYVRASTDKEYADKVMGRIFNYECFLREKYKERFFYILNKHINRWWD